MSSVQISAANLKPIDQRLLALEQQASDFTNAFQSIFDYYLCQERKMANKQEELNSIMQLILLQFIEKSSRTISIQYLTT